MFGEMCEVGFAVMSVEVKRKYRMKHFHGSVQASVRVGFANACIMEAYPCIIHVI